MALMMAEEAIRLLATHAGVIARHPEDVAARDKALYGSYLAASCLARLDMGLHHRICHVLGGRFDLGHADTHAALLPHVVAFQSSAADEAIGRVRRALDTDDAAIGLYDLAIDAGVPMDLESAGLKREDIDTAVELVVASKPYSPKRATAKGVRGVITAAFEGRRPTSRSRRAKGKEAPHESDSLPYLNGFGGTFESEAIVGALPRRQNSPRRNAQCVQLTFPNLRRFVGETGFKLSP